jgi:curved DNA-binding protein CbpA
MRGSLAEGVLPGILRDLYVARRTGRLHFTNGEERRSVLFRHGNIVNAESNVREDRLGETLVRLGLLTPADFDRATEVVVRDKKRLGAALEELGIMAPGRLQDVLALQVREILLKAFGWNDGTFEFEELSGDTPVQSEITLKLSTGEMILEAVRRVEDPDVVRYALGDIDRILALSNDPLLRFQNIVLSPTDGFVLSRVDGTLSAREVISLIPVPSAETQRSLFGLLCTGVIEYTPDRKPRPVEAPRVADRRAPTALTPVRSAVAPDRPAAAATEESVPRPLSEPAPLTDSPAAAVSPEIEARRREILKVHEDLRSKNHFEMLGIGRGANDVQVKEAYFRLAKRFHPDAHHDPALSDLAGKLEAIFIRLAEAYDLLRSPRQRSQYESDLAARAPRPEPAPAAEAGPRGPDPAEEARLAAASVQAAEKHFGEGRYWDAIQLLEPAVRRLEGPARNRASLLLARSLAKNPKWVKQAEETLQQLLHGDPRNVEAHRELAGLYKQHGLRSRAAASLRRVLEIRPDDEAVQAELAELEVVPEEPDRSSPGLLRKLFGKN